MPYQSQGCRGKTVNIPSQQPNPLLVWKSFLKLKTSNNTGRDDYIRVSNPPLPNPLGNERRQSKLGRLDSSQHQYRLRPKSLQNFRHKEARQGMFRWRAFIDINGLRDLLEFQN
jgi:hypothetical protein